MAKLRNLIKGVRFVQPFSKRMLIKKLCLSLKKIGQNFILVTVDLIILLYSKLYIWWTCYLNNQRAPIGTKGEEEWT